MADNAPQEAGASSMLPSVFAWLISLRISSKDAQGYTTALVALGFDDVLSLQEVRG